MKQIPPLLPLLIQGEEVDPQSFDGSTLEGWAGAASNSKLYLRDLAMEVSYCHLLEELSEPLKQKNIHPLVLGGISLWGDMYPVPGTRRVFDLDFWVPPEEIEDCQHVLRERGFKQHPQYHSCWMRYALEIDLHSHPLNSERAKAFDQLYTFDALDIYQRAEALPICPSDPWRRPAGEDLWVQHALHAVKHEFDRLNLLIDLHFLLTQHEPHSELGTKLWEICSPALKALNCHSPLAPHTPRKLAIKMLKERKNRPFLAGLRLLASCGASPFGFWWELAKGNSQVRRESGGFIQRYSRVFKRF